MRLIATESERRLQDDIRAFLAAEHVDATRLPRSLEDRMEILPRLAGALLRGRLRRARVAARVRRRRRPAAEQIVIDQELAAAGAPEFVNIVGLDVLGPSLLRYGTDEQRRRLHPPDPLRRGDLVQGLLGA